MMIRNDDVLTLVLIIFLKSSPRSHRKPGDIPRMSPDYHIIFHDSQPYYCGVGAPETSAGGGQSRSTKYLKFGHSMTDSFECDLSSLLGEAVYFYDPYIVDEVRESDACSG